MKKLLAIAACASAVAAFAIDVPVTLDLGQVGVTAVTSSTTNTIIAVSYTDLASGNVTASNLVKTANLTTGDHLYVYKDSDFYAFELKEGTGGVKYWDGVTTVDPVAASSAISADSNNARLAVGKGVWLVRGSGWDGNAFTFYIYGKPVGSLDPVTVTAGTSELVGNPTQSAKSPTFQTGPNNGDRILVPYPASKTGMRTYTYVNGTGWRYSLRQKDGYNFPDIPAGSGFWYVVPEGSGAVTVNW